MTTVYHKAFGQGTLIKNQGMFSTVTFNGEEKKLLTQTLSNEPIVILEVKKVLKKSVKKVTIKKEVSKLDQLISDILDVNHYTYTKTTSISFLNDLYKMKDFLTHNNVEDIALDIVKSVIKYKKASEKQAYILANKLVELNF